MGWDDRPQYRDGGDSRGARILRFLNGSIPLFTAFGIRVRAHAWLIIFIASVLLFDFSKNHPLLDRIVSMAVLAVVIILHEFGHCFAARSVGGDAEEILLWPLGGLAFARPPQRPWPTFVTVAGGPLVNVIICAACGLGIALLGGGIVSFNPYNNYLPLGISDLKHAHAALFWTGYYLFWFFRVSYILLLLNLIPMFPLDGGQMLQAMLWPKMGHFRSMHFAYLTGMVVAGPLAIFGLFRFDLTLVAIAAFGFIYCRQHLAFLREVGPESEYGGDAMDYSASLRPDPPSKKRRRVSQWTIRRLRREAQRDADEQQAIDNILAKVSAQGMHTLTWSERRALKRATDRQRQRDLELSRRD